MPRNGGPEAGPAGEAPFGRGFVVTRVFDAPRGLVFRAWTEPERLKRWWGPEGYTMPVCEMDPRPGGVFFHCMRSPEGRDFWGRGVFREVVVPERLVLTDSFADETGNVVPATRYGLSPDWPLETLMTVTFDEQGSSTRVTVRHAGIPSDADGDAARRVVERTFSWIDRDRRTSKDHERLCASAEAFVYAAMIRLMARRLARA